MLANQFAELPPCGTWLAINITVVDQPVPDLLRKSRIRATIQPMTITTGNSWTANESAGGWSVSRTALVSTLQVLSQQRRIRIARTLREAPLLVRELERFVAKPKMANSDSLDLWRDRPHDDLVLAIAIAPWIGERAMRKFWMAN